MSGLPAVHVGLDQCLGVTPECLAETDYGLQVRLFRFGGSTLRSQRMDHAMYVSGKCSKFGNGAPEGHEFVFRQRAETSQMGADEYRGVGCGPHPACERSFLQQKRVVGTDADGKAIDPEVC